MNQTQLAFLTDQAGASQEQTMLDYLSARAGQWVSLRELVSVVGGYAIHSRAAALRKKGHPIQNRVDRTAKPYKSYYRFQP